GAEIALPPGIPAIQVILRFIVYRYADDALVVRAEFEIVARKVAHHSGQVFGLLLIPAAPAARKAHSPACARIAAPRVTATRVPAAGIAAPRVPAARITARVNLRA